MVAKEAKRNEVGLVVAEVSTPKIESPNLVQNEEWAFTTVCNFDPSSLEQCMSILE